MTARPDLRRMMVVWLPVLGALAVALSSTLGALALKNINTEILRAQANISEIERKRPRYINNMTTQRRGTIDVATFSGVARVETRLNPSEPIPSLPLGHSITDQFEESSANILYAYKEIPRSCQVYWLWQPEMEGFITEFHGANAASSVNRACSDVRESRPFVPPVCARFITPELMMRFVPADSIPGGHYAELRARLDCAESLYAVPMLVAEAYRDIMWELVFDREDRYGTLQLTLSVLTLIGLTLVLLKDIPAFRQTPPTENVENREQLL